ncbi:MAG: hypothetical protein IJ584_01375 [Bacteroidales bacterium]|nr:hypothetical protein [Bacteroidales bacterium]MBR1433743.1 hypothetical protein [Bacteroidales bacterium]
MRIPIALFAAALFSGLFQTNANASAINQDAQRDTLYATVTVPLIDDTLTSHILTQVKKGTALSVIDINAEKNSGVRFLVNDGKNEGWIFGKYLTPSKEEAEKVHDFMMEKHREVRNPYKGGLATDCDFSPYEKPHFPDNEMPNPCNALYLNISPSGLKKIDDFIALADSTLINAFVIDIKDNEAPGFKAEAMKKFSPTSYSRAGSTKEELYRQAVEKLHAKGYYVIGRITCFKDNYFAKDHPETCMSSKADGKPYQHSKSYWPSPYSRLVWQYNVELAKEAVRKIGFDEINFDYVRFPDRLTKIDGLLDFKNAYSESKVEVIQRFVRYACDELHRLGVYVSVDVFGESSNPGYTTAYGQYWPAISNVADAICAMPYPDHFADKAFGLTRPWNQPYRLMKAWGTQTKGQQEKAATPAVARTWIQAYHVMRSVDPEGIPNDASYIEKQVRGLFDAGLTGGYMTWLSSCSLKTYRAQAAAYDLDYPSLSPVDDGKTFITTDPKKVAQLKKETVRNKEALREEKEAMKVAAKAEKAENKAAKAEEKALADLQKDLEKAEEKARKEAEKAGTETEGDE